MTSQGHVYAQFQRALKTGNAHLAFAAAAELRHVDVADALSLVLLSAATTAPLRARCRQVAQSAPLPAARRLVVRGGWRFRRASESSLKGGALWRMGVRTGGRGWLRMALCRSCASTLRSLNRSETILARTGRRYSEPNLEGATLDCDHALYEGGFRRPSIKRATEGGLVVAYRSRPLWERALKDEIVPRLEDVWARHGAFQHEAHTLTV